MCDGIMIIMFLCIFDCYECCALLERLTICTFCRAMRHALVNLECVRMQRLNRAAGLVAEVQCALVSPLWLTRDATREAESFAIAVDDL